MQVGPECWDNARLHKRDIFSTSELARRLEKMFRLFKRALSTENPTTIGQPFQEQTKSSVEINRR